MKEMTNKTLLICQVINNYLIYNAIILENKVSRRSHSKNKSYSKRSYSKKSISDQRSRSNSNLSLDMKSPKSKKSLLN